MTLRAYVKQNLSSDYNVSPSQIGTYLDCQRKWAWAKIDKISAPPHASAALGSATHSVLETYLEGGGLVFDPLAPHIGNIAQSGIHFLPEPNAPGLAIETAFKFPGPPGVQYNGRIDFLVAPGFGPGGIPLIGDHKTTSGLQWAKTADDLREDPQGVIYGAYAFRAFPLVEHVDLRWVYYQTKKPYRAHKVELRWSREENSKALEIIDLTAGQIAAKSRTVQTALDLPATPSACEKFGGCPYRGRCNLSPRERLQSVFGSPLSLTLPTAPGSTTMSLLEKMRKNIKAATEADTATAPPAKATEAATSYVCPDKAPNGLPVPPRVLKSGLIKYNGSYVTLADLDVFSRETALDQAATEYSLTEGSAVNPPESSVEVPTPTKAVSVPAVLETKAEKAAPEETVVEKAKRKRRTKAEMEAAKAAEESPEPKAVAEAVTDEILEQEIIAPAPEASNPLAAASGTSAIGVLFVGCKPMKFPTVLFSSLVKDANEALAKEGIEDYSLLDYGAGAGMFRVAILDALKNAGHIEALYIDRATREASICLATLAGMSAEVVTA